MVLLAHMSARAPCSTGLVSACSDCLSRLKAGRPWSPLCRAAAGQRLTGDISRASSPSSTGRGWGQIASFQLRRTASIALQATLQRTGTAQRYGSGVPAAAA